MMIADSPLSTRLSLSPEQAEKLYALIADIDAVRYGFMRQHQAPATLQHLTASAAIASTGASARLESRDIRDDDLRTVYRNLGSIRKFKTRDLQETAGYLKTLQRIFSDYSSIVLDEPNILQLHKDFLSYSEHDQEHIGCYRSGSFRGEFRLPGDGTIGLTFHAPPPEETQNAIRQSIAWYQSACAENYKHPLILIAVFIFEFTMAMPFWVGATRMSRLLTNLLLMQHGYGFAAVASHEGILERQKEEYNGILDRAFEARKRGTHDLAEWLLFIIGTFRELALEAQQQLAEGDQVEVLLSSKQSALWAWAQQEREFARADAIAALGYPARTAEAIILKLSNLGKLRRLGLGRATRYRVAA